MTAQEKFVASVVLCVRNGEHVIEGQLRALADLQMPRPWELVLVDNGSTDGTPQILREWIPRFSAVEVVVANEAVGLAHARNVGARAANGTVLAFCDADDEVDPRWLVELVAATRPGTIVGGSLEYAQLNTAEALTWRSLDSELSQITTGFDHLPHVIGANFSIRRDDYLRVGGCDEQFTTSCDEVDLSWRCIEAGMSVESCPAAIVHYRLRQTIRETCAQQRNYGLSAVALFRKHRSSMPRQGSLRALLPYGRALLWSHQLVRGRRRRGAWLAGASYRIGRLRGSLRHRVWFP